MELYGLYKPLILIRARTGALPSVRSFFRSLLTRVILTAAKLDWKKEGERERERLPHREAT